MSTHEPRAGPPFLVGHLHRFGLQRDQTGALPRTDLPKRYLQAGDLMVCRDACEVTTVLGSCVAVTFFNRRLELAAICHAMLPFPRSGDDQSEFWEQRWKYVNYAVEELIRCFQQPGLPASQVEVKIFGGAHLLPGTDHPSPRATVGSANVLLAQEMLAEAGFTIIAGDIGGGSGRKVVFDTRTGDVHVKRLRRSAAPV